MELDFRHLYIRYLGNGITFYKYNTKLKVVSFSPLFLQIRNIYDSKLTHNLSARDRAHTCRQNKIMAKHTKTKIEYRVSDEYTDATHRK